MRSMRMPAAAAALLAACAAACAEGPLKVAVLDMERAMKAHPETEVNRMVLEQQREEFENEQRALVKRRQGLRDDFESSREQLANEALSDEARAKARSRAEEILDEMQRCERDLRETTAVRQKQLTEQSVKMQQRTMDRVREIVRAYCEKEGIDLVIDSSRPGLAGLEPVVYSHARLDITEVVVKKVAEDGK